MSNTDAPRIAPKAATRDEAAAAGAKLSWRWSILTWTALSLIGWGAVLLLLR